MSVRFKLEPGDVPPRLAARRMGLSEPDFCLQLEALLQRGFPPADATTGNYDLDAIDAWRRSRFPHLFRGPSLTGSSGARDAKDVVRDRLAGIRRG